MKISNFQNWIDRNKPENTREMRLKLLQMDETEK